MSDSFLKQGRSYDASVVIEKLEGKNVADAKDVLDKLEISEVKDVRGLVDQLLAPGNEEDREKYGAIKEAADKVYGKKLEAKKEQLLPDEDIEGALKPLELTEEEAEDEDVAVSGIEAGTLWQQPAAKTRPRTERMAEEAAEAAPPAEEVEALKGKHERLRENRVTAWLKKYGREQVEQGLITMFGAENKKKHITPEKLDRFLHALQKNPEQLPSPELDDIRMDLEADVSSEVVTDVLKDRIENDKPPLPETESKAA